MISAANFSESKMTIVSPFFDQPPTTPSSASVGDTVPEESPELSSVPPSEEAVKVQEEPKPIIHGDACLVPVGMRIRWTTDSKWVDEPDPLQAKVKQKEQEADPAPPPKMVAAVATKGEEDLADPETEADYDTTGQEKSADA